jgi:hypothetical protein
MLRDWGSTAEERARPYPCDTILADSDEDYFRAVDVAAPVPVVFRWLCQLRVAPYSYDLLDNGGRRSPRTLTPGLEALAVGQPVMRIFELASFARDEHLTLRLVHARRLFGELAVTYAVQARPEGGTRLVVKLRVRHGTSPFARARGLLLLGDFVMMRKQLLTLKAYAEATAATAG